MIERQATADLINKFVNDPDVYPHLCGAHRGWIDVGRVVADENNVILCGERGGVIFVKHGPGYYEAHTAVLRAGRGKWTAQMGREALRWMFLKTDALEIATKCPHGNVAAAAGARMVGARHEWTTRPLWPSGAEIVPVDIYMITLQEWAARNRQTLEYAGRAFHDWLTHQGIPADHDEDATHDAYVGCAVEMIEHGQPQKGVGFYNRWAVMSNYRPIFVTSGAPLTLDIGTAKLVRESGGWRADRCQQAA